MKILMTSLLLLLYMHAGAQNYDESKVPAYTLPELLKTSSGKMVNNVKTWEQVRRPELLQLFAENVYGQTPKSFDNIRFTTVKEDTAAMDGRARLKEVDISVTHRQKEVTIHLVVFIPNNAGKPAPVFLLINNRGRSNTDPSRIKKSEFWPAEMAIDSGYAIAAFHVSDLAPDNKTDYVKGLLQLYPELLTQGDGMKAIGSWAFGASRVMDYFEKEPLIDAKRVGLVGHSRGGKTSLWATAQDRRFALCFSSCSGNTGAALARRQFGERITRINATFPHWFSDNYRKFNDNENALPVDQHMLIALVAPRPVYVTNATKDLWADPVGTFLALKHAEPAYALYEQTSHLPATQPAVNAPVIDSPLAYHFREGEHDLNAWDWSNFIRFANFQYRKK